MEFDAPTELLGGPVSDCKAEPRASAYAVACLVDSVEAVEDAFAMLGRDTDAGVADDDGESAAPPVCAEFNVAARRRVSNRIRQQIHDHRLDQSLVRVRQERGGVTF
ncbi:MAG: hypothetical protein M3R39_10055 [Actinomycetota bacterium]|nr:hypothetical protein [Actinomycetota bacterium]